MNAALYNELKNVKDIKAFNKTLKANDMNGSYMVKKFRCSHDPRPTYGLWECMDTKHWRLLCSSPFIYELAWALHVRL